ncbi:unnamed protein product [Orchesella dallaii]|uniref:Peptidase S1 domain-containing protein n=1 Tax=Orchesella dallaii TaxID=48710 RepID=A0ABP1RV87_9HEXA
MNNFIFFLLSGSFTLATGYKTEAPPISENKTLTYKNIEERSVSEEEFPYQIRIQEVGSFVCGGSLITVKGSYFILTAAHCVRNVPASELTVVAGEVDRYKVSGNEQTRQVTRIVIHRGYSYPEFYNDIALLAIDKPFTVNSYVSPIPLPTQGQKTTGDVIVTGWDFAKRTEFKTTRFLNQMRLTIIDDNICRLSFMFRFQWVPDSMLCTGIGYFVWDNSNPCDKASGGSMKAVNGGYLAGISSWKPTCRSNPLLGMNTEVSYFVDWIEHEATLLL